MATRLVAADPSARHRDQLGETFCRLGEIHHEAGDGKSSDQFYEGAITFWIRQMEADATTNRASNALARVYLDSGTAKHARGEYAEARGEFERAVALRDRLARESPSLFDSILLLGSCYAALGSLSHDRGATEEAHTWYQKAAETYREFLEREPGRADVCDGLARLQSTCSVVRYRDPIRAVNLAETAVGRSPGDRAFRKTLGVAHYRAGHWAEAISALEGAMRLGAGRDPETWLCLAMAHWHQGRRVEARRWYDKAAAWMGRYRWIDPNLRRFRGEAVVLLGIADCADAGRPRRVREGIAPYRPADQPDGLRRRGP